MYQTRYGYIITAQAFCGTFGIEPCDKCFDWFVKFDKHILWESCTIVHLELIEREIVDGKGHNMQCNVKEI